MQNILNTITTNLFFATIISVLVVGLLLGILVMRSFSKRKKPARIVNSVVILKRIQEMMKIVFVSYNEGVVYVYETQSGSHNVFRWLFNDRIELYAQGEIMAGLDFDKFERNSIVLNGRHAQITLPVAEIIMSKIDNRQTRVISHRGGLFARTRDTQSMALIEAEEKVIQAAQKAGIFEKVNQEACKRIEGMFRPNQLDTLTIYTSTGVYRKTFLLPGETGLFLDMGSSDRKRLRK